MSKAKTINRASRPDDRQCAMLIAHLLRKKGEESRREVTRARLSPGTLQRLLGRQSINPQLITDIGEWLLRAGWVLFFAGSTFAVVKADVVDGWGRISSKLIREDLHKVARGEFEFDSLEELLLATDSAGEEPDV